MIKPKRLKKGDKILFVETSEDKPSPDFIKWSFRNLAAQGILREIKGIISELDCEQKTITFLESPTV